MVLKGNGWCAAKVNHHNDMLWKLWDLVFNHVQVKHLYGDGHIPEIAAKPGDDTLYVNIWDKVRARSGLESPPNYNISMIIKHHTTDPFYPVRMKV